MLDACSYEGLNAFFVSDHLGALVSTPDGEAHMSVVVRYTIQYASTYSDEVIGLRIQVTIVSLNRTHDLSPSVKVTTNAVCFTSTNNIPNTAAIGTAVEEKGVLGRGRGSKALM